MKILSISLICAGLLAGCATTSSVATTQAQSTAVAWNSLDIIAKTLDALAVSRTLHGENAATASADLTKAAAALTAADNARIAGNTASADANIAIATQLIAELIAISKAP